MCDCGQTKVIRRDAIISGMTSSCGCLGKEMRLKSTKKHGLSKCSSTFHPLYGVWDSMIQRCTNNKNHKYYLYGGRKTPITVCDEWRKNFALFYEWSINNGYIKGKQLDRIDNNSGYSPMNCRYVTPAENNRNKRNNVLVEFDGEVMCLQDIANITNINAHTLSYRLKKGLPLLDKRQVKINIGNIKFKNNIAKKRIEINLTQEQLGKLIGVSKTTIYEWEIHRKIPNHKRLKQLANIFNVEESYLLKKSGE